MAARLCRRCRLPQGISEDHDRRCTWHPSNRVARLDAGLRSISQPLLRSEFPVGGPAPTRSGTPEALLRLVSGFSAEMRSKLLLKDLEGLDSWREVDVQNLKDAIRSHVARACGDPAQWVDVANFAAFLWWREAR